jgi:tRNA (guanine-N7-)-methyltransferase
LEELAPYRWEPGNDAERIDWSAVFGNRNPVEIEVGCGKGLFIINAAQACPEVNFFGVEIVRKYQLYTATRVAIRKLVNVRLACADAKLIIRDRVPSNSVQAIHVYYPDPWWKKRHHKRRVFTPEFIESCAKALAIGGRFELATDVQEYFGVMTELCRQCPDLRELPPRRIETGRHDMDYLTNFERKALRTGRPVFRARFERI